MALLDIVNKVIDLATKCDDETNRVMRELDPDDLGIRLGSKESFALLSVPRPAQDALKKYLETLKEPELLKLQTLMYAGMDREDIRELHKNLIANTEGKEDAIQTMMRKAPLHQYLADGLDAARSQGVNLDDPF